MGFPERRSGGEGRAIPDERPQGMEPAVDSDEEKTVVEVPPLGAPPAVEAPPQKEVSPAKSDPERDARDLSLAVDHPMVQKYQPKYLAAGGEHFVYEIPGRPDIVVKVEFPRMRALQSNNIAKGLPLGAMDPEILPHMEKDVSESRARSRTLAEHFGKDRVLGIKQALLRVPVTPELLSLIHGGKSPVGAEETKEAWAIVRVQKRAREFSDPERKTILSSYAEFREQDPDAYRRVTAVLVEGDEKAQFSPKEFTAIMPPRMQELLALADTDESLREVLIDFVQRTVGYVKETGEILDLAGKDNVTVFKDGDRWRYRLVDALYPGKGDHSALGRAGVIAEKAAKGEPLQLYESVKLMNVLNFVRTINGLAERLGVPDRLSFVPEAAKGQVDYLALLKKTKPSGR